MLTCISTYLKTIKHLSESTLSFVSGLLCLFATFKWCLHLVPSKIKQNTLSKSSDFTDIVEHKMACIIYSKPTKVYTL